MNKNLNNSKENNYYFKVYMNLKGKVELVDVTLIQLDGGPSFCSMQDSSGKIHILSPEFIRENSLQSPLLDVLL